MAVNIRVLLLLIFVDIRIIIFVRIDNSLSFQTMSAVLKSVGGVERLSIVEWLRLKPIRCLEIRLVESRYQMSLLFIILYMTLLIVLIRAHSVTIPFSGKFEYINL